MSETVTFIGAGNMAKSLILGLINDKSSMKIRVADPSEEQLDVIRQHWPEISVTTDNVEAIEGADIVVLAVKPQIMQDVCIPIAAAIQEGNPVVLSVAAGVREKSLNAWFGGGVSVVRCMPNTPALVQAAATGLYANPRVTSEQRNMAENILRSVGIIQWFESESDLDVVTAVSGSGPAYYFLVMEAMQVAAIKMGMSEAQARLFIAQTAFGASKLALESNENIDILRQRVMSKAGTTEAAINVLLANELPQAFEKAMYAAKQRSEELSLIKKEG